MMYKVVARITSESRYYEGKIGTQWKKKIYLNEAKFNKHSPDLIYRWLFHGHSVTIYQSDDGENWTEKS